MSSPDGEDRVDSLPERVEEDPAGDAAEHEQEAGSEAALPEPIESVLEEIPPDQREKVRNTFLGLGLAQYMGPVPHPLFGKMKDEHLDKLIDGADKDNERSYADKDRRRGHVRFLTITAIVAFLFASGLFIWTDQTVLLENLVQIGVIFVGGMGVGLGFLRKSKN